MVEEIISRVYAYRISRLILKGCTKRFLIKGVNSFRRSRLKRLKTPEAIVLFVTNSCQMRCEFCFYKKKLNVTEKQPSLKEIECLARSLRGPSRIVLTGGEPFLREDLDDICRIFNKYCKTKYISIVTNGFLTEKIQNEVKAILDSTRLRYLKIQVSLDALGGHHDRLRGVDGAFDNAVVTLKALKDLQAKHKNLFLEIASLVTTFLIYDIKEFIDYFQEFHIPIKFSIIRSAASGLFGLAQGDSSRLLPEPNPVFPSLEELGRFYKLVKKLNYQSKYRFWSPFQQMKFQNSLNILKERKRIFPCYAGRADAVIYNDADVAFCENTIPIGNLRDYNFDFYSLWNSKKANIFRDRINKCACIHGCNIITSMSYDDETLVKLL